MASVSWAFLKGGWRIGRFDFTSYPVWTGTLKCLVLEQYKDHKIENLSPFEVSFWSRVSDKT